MIQIDMDMPKNCGECFVGNRTICHDGCPLKEVKHGKWIMSRERRRYGDYEENTWTCSECGYRRFLTSRPDDKYCKECGARMDG